MFRRLNDRVLASPQISLADVANAASQGVVVIVNNRPDGESDDQVPGSEIEAAAKAAGMGYVAIPVTHAGWSEGQVRAMANLYRAKLRTSGTFWPIADRAPVRPCCGHWPRQAPAPALMH